MSASPLSRPFVVATVPQDGLRIEIVADAAERAALAAENEVESIEALKAVFDLRPIGRDGLGVRGWIDGETTRICVVTLEPFAETVRENVDLRFAPNVGAGAEQGDDPPDPIVGGVVDLGAVAAEFFSLGLDPYPRKPGASFAEPNDEGETSPFAVLGALRRSDRDGA